MSGRSRSPNPKRSRSSRRRSPSVFRPMTPSPPRSPPRSPSPMIEYPAVEVTPTKFKKSKKTKRKSKVSKKSKSKSQSRRR